MSSFRNFLVGLGDAVPQALQLYQNQEVLDQKARALRSDEEYKAETLRLRGMEMEDQRGQREAERVSRQLQDDKLRNEMAEKQKQTEELRKPRPLLSMPGFASMPEETQKTVQQDLLNLKLAEVSPSGVITTNLEQYNIWDQQTKGSKDGLIKLYAPEIKLMEEELVKSGEKLRKLRTTGDQEGLAKETENFNNLSEQYNTRLAIFNKQLVKVESKTKMGREDILAAGGQPARNIIEAEKEIAGAKKTELVPKTLEERAQVDPLAAKALQDKRAHEESLLKQKESAKSREGIIGSTKEKLISRIAEVGLEKLNPNEKQAWNLISKEDRDYITIASRLLTGNFEFQGADAKGRKKMFNETLDMLKSIGNGEEKAPVRIMKYNPKTGKLEPAE